jgi:hypothetical protein
VHVRALVGPDTGALDVAGEPDPDLRPCSAISLRNARNSSQPTSALSFASDAG